MELRDHTAPDGLSPISARGEHKELLRGCRDVARCSSPSGILLGKGTGVGVSQAVN